MSLYDAMREMAVPCIQWDVGEPTGSHVDKRPEWYSKASQVLGLLNFMKAEAASRLDQTAMAKTGKKSPTQHPTTRARASVSADGVQSTRRK